MVITTSDYNDFKLLVNQFDCSKTIIFCIVSVNQFEVSGFDKNQSLSIGLSTNTEPSSFSSDFPHAISLSVNFGVNG